MSKKKPEVEMPQFIQIEISERNFLIAKKTIGTKDQYLQVATCRNRAQTERLVALLNKGE